MASGLLSRVNSCFIILTVVCTRLHVRCYYFLQSSSGQWSIIVSVTLFSANEMIAVSIVTIQLRTITSGQLSSLPCIATCVCLVSKKLRNLLGARWWNVEKADWAACVCSNVLMPK